MAESKIKIRLGEIEIEYEGASEFLKSELPELLNAVSKLHKENYDSSNSTSHLRDRPPRAPVNPISGTVTTFAQKMSVASGSELLMAAAAHLMLDQKKESFSRKELTGAASSAKQYFKRSYQNNYGNYISTLIKAGDLNEVGASVYTVPHAVLSKLEQKLV